MSSTLHLKTALLVPLLELEQIFLSQQIKIEEWFKAKWQLHNPPIYGSVDLRNSGFKLTPVDLNLFPGGFNNIEVNCIPFAVEAFKNLLSTKYPEARKILLIPENHTRNHAYLHNVHTLNSILKQTGLEVQMSLLSDELMVTTTLTLEDGKTITYHPLKRVDNTIQTTEGFIPDLILVNNDLSTGRPVILDGISQAVLPPLHAGWYMRKKTNFFTVYDKVCDEFGDLIGIDPWRINAFFSHCHGLNFSERVGLEELAAQVDNILNKIKVKYQEHNIQKTPYVIVKANNGTYGMGIMAIKSAEQILAINRKARNKMAVIKDGIHVSDVIIQEGVHTIEDIDGQIAEPVIYMVDDSVVGAFYRVHPEKGHDENLNASGAHFIPMATLHNNTSPNRFYAYSVVARLSLLASSLELDVYC